jgi:hypothetical protein
MIIDDQLLKGIVKNNPSAALLAEAQKDASLLNAHITGAGLSTIIRVDDYFEDDQKKNLRQKYARSNRDLFARIHRPIDKAFTAKGGSIIYNLPEAQEKKLAAYLAKIRNGMPLRKWVKAMALPAYEIDPMGVIFMELNAQRQPYPTYRATSDIFSYKLNGRKLEYIIFKISGDDVRLAGKNMGLPDTSLDGIFAKLPSLNATPKFIRVVDDVSDRIYRLEDGQQYIEIPELTMPNYWMYVPGMIVSDLVKYNSQCFQSPDADIVELANDFLTDCSVFNIWKKLHGFPKAWRTKTSCSTCMGSGLVRGVECPDCNGTGNKKKATVRDELIVPIPDDGKMPTTFGGYITPDIEGWNLMRDEMTVLEDMMFMTSWGTIMKRPTDKAQPETATSEFINAQAINERLPDFSAWAETIETFIITAVGQIMFNPGYQGPSVNYGNRFIIEGPDVIWNKYADARAEGAPQAALDGLLRDYYESRYEGSPMDLNKALKLMKVEPWTHLTIDQVQASSALQIDKIAKTYFSEWISTKTDMEILSTDEQALRDDLMTYAEDKNEQFKEQQTEMIAQQQAAAGTDVSPEDKAIDNGRKAIQKTRIKKGMKQVQQ